MTGKELMPLGRCENDMATIFVKSRELLFLYQSRNAVREEISYKNKISMMTVQEAIEARHSVRAYKDQPLSWETVKVLEYEIL